LSSSGYRIYGESEAGILRQILFYRELGVSLGEIKKLLDDPDHDKEKSLQEHLNALVQKKARIETLIDNVGMTIQSLVKKKSYNLLLSIL
jgi:DNA-binding transcriptional MerR regulator